MEVKLVVVGGDAKPTEIKLKLPAIIGRGRAASLTLPHPLVSRQHCELYESGGKLFVRDMGSLNGTFVGEEKIDEAALESGSLLTIGNVTFRPIYGESVVSPETDVTGMRKANATAKATESVDFEVVDDDEIEEVGEEFEEIEEIEEIEDFDVEEVSEIEEISEIEESDPLDPPGPKLAETLKTTDPTESTTGKKQQETEKAPPAGETSKEKANHDTSPSQDDQFLKFLDDEEESEDSDDDDLNSFLRDFKR